MSGYREAAGDSAEAPDLAPPPEPRRLPYLEACHRIAVALAGVGQRSACLEISPLAWSRLVEEVASSCASLTPASLSEGVVIAGPCTLHVRWRRDT